MWIDGYNHWYTEGEIKDLLFTKDKKIKELEAQVEAFNSINNEPSADVQPVKRGKWIWVKDYRDCECNIYSQYKCSCCDFGVGGIYSVEDLTHFCPNCGARMGGDAE